jgi:CheY-like chemotaxis protein
LPTPWRRLFADRPNAPLDRARSRRILIVDDQATIRDTLGELLELEGYQVETAQDGLDALRHLRQAKPDAVVVDLMMPVLDGWGLARACRADPALADLAMIVMSARPDAAESVAELNVQACLTKPFEVDELLEALEQTWTVGRSCAICGRPPLLRELRVFVEGAREESWAMCTSCWRAFGTGFHRLRPDGSLEQYLGRPGFCITDAELQTYLRVGLP